MKRSLNLLALTALSCAAAGTTPPAPQEDPQETRTYTVAFLTRPLLDRPGPRFGIAIDSIGVAVASGEEESSPIPPDSLIEILRTNIAPESWREPGATIDSGEGTLLVTNRKSVHSKIREVLDSLKFAFGSLITIDAAVVSADPAFFARVRAAGPADRPSALLPDEAKKLLAAAREGKEASLVKTLRLTAHPRQRVYFHEGAQQSYLRDHDVQIASSAVALNPVVDVLTTGTGIELVAFPEPLGNLVTLEVRADTSELLAMDERTLKLLGTAPAPGAPPSPETKVPDAAKDVVHFTGEARVQLPRITHEWLRTSLTGRNGETLVVGTTWKKGRVLAFLVTPTVQGMGGPPPAEAPLAGDRTLRVYDLSSLTRPIQDYPSPTTELLSPQRGGGGPLTGATFTLDEPRAGMGIETILDLVKSHVASDTWEMGENAISAQGKNLLVVRQKPDVQKEVERYIRGLSQEHSTGITTEALAIAFKKGALAEWEKSLPALLPGGYFAEDAGVAKLLEEAMKGVRLRLAGQAEITGYPRQRVYVAGALEESYIEEFEPQVSTNAAQFDPIMGILLSGSVLDVRPAFMDGPDRIGVDLRASLTTREMKELETASTGVGPLQIPRLTGPRWQTDLVSQKGHWTLVAIESRGEGDAREDLALFVRARPNLLK